MVRALRESEKITKEDEGRDDICSTACSKAYNSAVKILAICGRLYWYGLSGNKTAEPVPVEVLDPSVYTCTAEE